MSLETHAYLKDQTSALHNQAEHALQSKGTIETKTGLRHFLHCMLESQIQFHHEHDQASKLAGLECQSSELIRALEKDLGREASTLPTNNIGDDNTCLGVGYVFEGSALGAKIIQKRLSASGLDCPEYLHSINASDHSRWPRFLSTLNGCTAHKELLLGAETAFNYIISQGEQH